MGTTTLNVDIAIGIFAKITTFAIFADTRMLVIPQVRKFKYIGRVIAFDANFCFFAKILTLFNAHGDESWTTSRKVRAMIVI